MKGERDGISQWYSICEKSVVGLKRGTIVAPVIVQIWAWVGRGNELGIDAIGFEGIYRWTNFVEILCNGTG